MHQGFVRAPSYSQNRIFLKVPQSPGNFPLARKAKLGPLRMSFSIFGSADPPERLLLHPGFDSSIFYLKGPSLRKSHPGPRVRSERSAAGRTPCLAPLPLQAAGCSFQTPFSFFPRNTGAPVSWGLISGKPESGKPSSGPFCPCVCRLVGQPINSIWKQGSICNPDASGCPVLDRSPVERELSRFFWKRGYWVTSGQHSGTLSGWGGVLSTSLWTSPFPEGGNSTSSWSCKRKFHRVQAGAESQKQALWGWQ